jgi:hypothetical protein
MNLAEKEVKEQLEKEGVKKLLKSDKKLSGYYWKSGGRIRK